ncbi:PKD domain-containing protein [Fulvivirga sp. M361]|uniref:PKD-like domain-containing protein n=1 Tax=Fulvivirga sp. M361 TaxID=2594266 RepID=UPI00117A12AF|nr:PKD-like domain-containing protein [Fulvivirga sp. M361]TRX62073.1 PKD domain-containing protein [Fulvivirga sp. M361]
MATSLSSLFRHIAVFLLVILSTISVVKGEDFLNTDPVEEELCSVSPAVDFNFAAVFAGFSLTTAWFRTSMNEAGTVYVTLYTADPGVLTSADVLNHHNGIGVPPGFFDSRAIGFDGADDPTNPPFAGASADGSYPYGGAQFTGLTNGTNYWYAMAVFDVGDANAGSTVIQNNDVAGGQPCSQTGGIATDTGGSDSDLCGPRNVSYSMSLTGIQYQDPNTVFFSFNFQFEAGIGIPFVRPTILNPGELNINAQQWEATDTFTYPDNGTECNFAVPAFLVYTNQGRCTNVGETVTFEVFDDLANNNLGQIDIIDPLDGDTEIEVCEGEDVTVNFNNSTVLNCVATTLLEDDDNPVDGIFDRPNTQKRWYQYVYGTNAADADFLSDVEVDATPEGNGTITAFPFFSQPVFLATADETTPLDPSYDIRVLPTNVFAPAGKRFVVQLRMWNICNAYDNDGVFPFDNLSPDNNDLVNGDNAPVTDEAEIILVQQPPVPTAVPKDICNGNTLPDFEITIPPPGNFDFVNWFDDDPNAGGNFIIQTGGTTLGAIASGVVPNNTTAGTYTVWAAYQRPTTGTGTDCLSEAIPTTIDIREALSNPGTINSTSTFPICADAPNIVFTVPDPAGTGTPGGTVEYDWRFGGGTLDDNLSFVGPRNGQSVTVDITSSTASGTRRIRVRRRYVNGDDDGDECQTGFVNFDFDIDAVSVAGTVSGGTEICSGDGTGNIILSGNTGSTIIWQRSVNGGPFNGLGAGFDDFTIISEAALTAGGTSPVTYDYRALVTNGACSQVTSGFTRFTVNPIPSDPTITTPSTDICEDVTTVLTANSNAAADSYQWYRNGVAVPGETNATITLGTVAESGDYTVEAIGVTPTFCTSNLSAPTEVTINPLPTATVSGGGSVCAGNPAPPAVITFTGTGPFNVTYERNGNPTTDNSVTSPYTIPGSTTVVSPPTNDVYVVTSVTDLGTTVNCTVNAPSPNITGSATIAESAVAPPTIEGVTVEPAACEDDVAANTDAPDIVVDLAPDDATQQYDITYTINGGAPIVINNQVVDASGVFRIQPDYVADLGTTPGTYGYEITSIVNVTSFCTATGLPSGPHNVIINPRPSDPTNAVNGIACSNPGTGVALSVDVPPAGTRIRWYQDAALTIDAVPAAGAISGSATRDEIFIPTNSTTATFHAVVENTTTLCQSRVDLSVTITEDTQPAPPAAQADDQTCDDFYVLSATAASPAAATGFWSTTGTLYYENFDDLADGTSADTGLFGWTTDVSSLVNYFPSGDYFEVRSGRFEGRDLGDGSTSAFWLSDVIDVSTINTVDITALLYKNGDLETGDFIEIYYVLDGARTRFGELTRVVNDSGPSLLELPVSSLGLDVSAVNDLQIEVRIRGNAGDETQGIDDIIVREASSTSLTFDNIFDTGTTVRGLQDGANSVFWNVVSQFGVCSPASEEVIITKIAAPIGTDATDQFCEDTFNGTVTTGVDLSVYDGVVTGGTPNRSVQWFTDVNRTIPVPLTGPGPDPIVTVNDGDEFYALITETLSGSNCQNIVPGPGSMTFTVIDLPATADQDITNPETEFCEDTPGSGVFGAGAIAGVDLRTMDDDVANGITANRTVAWFVDAAYTIPVPDPTDVEVSDGDIYFARITETTSGESCFNDAQVEITVSSRPGNNDIVGDDFQCVDASSLQIYQITPGPPGTTYTWTINPLFTTFGGGTINDPFVILQFPTSGTADISVVETAAFTNVNCDGIIETKTIVVENAPTGLTITGPDEVCANEAGVSFSTASLPNTTYDWQVPVGSSIISGQGSAAITVNFGNTGGNVLVTPTSTTGNCSGTVPPKPVTINPRPVLSSALSKIVCSDSNTEVTLAVDISSPVAASNYNVTASVAPGLSANTGPTTGNGLTDAAIFNDNFTNTTGGPLNVTYVVTPVSADNCEGAPVNVVVTIDPEPVMATGLDVIQCSDAALGLTLDVAAGSVVAANYNVTLVDVPLAITADVTNATVPQSGVSANYLANDHYTNNTASPVIVEYTVIPVSMSGCLGNPLVINATINPEPVIDPALDDIACSDDAIGVTLASDGVSVNAASFNVVSINVPGGLLANTGNAGPGNGVPAGHISGDRYTNQTINNIDVIYNVRGISADGCEGDLLPVTVTIRPEPVVNPSISNTVCSDDVASITLASAGTAVAAATYNILSVSVPTGLTADPGNAGIPASGQSDNYISNDIYTNQTGAALNVTYEVQGVSADLCVGDTETVTLTVNPEPVIDPNLDAVRCSGQTVGVTLNTNGTSVGAISFDVVSITPQTGLVSDPGNVSAANGVAANYILNAIFTNTGSIPLTVDYVIRGRSADGCLGDNETITITYNPEPVISTALDNTVCSDIPININFATNGASVTAANFNVIGVTVPTGVTANGSNVLIPASNVSAGYIVADRYTNPTGGDLSVIYEVRGVSAAGCEGESEFITAIIQPEPVVSSSLDATICSDEPINLILASNGSSIPADNYNILSRSVPAGLTPGTSAIVPANSVSDNYLNLETFTNQTTGPLQVEYEVQGVSAVGCIGDVQLITITINPEPIVNTGLDQVVCSDAASGITLLTAPVSVGAASYNIVDVTIPLGLTPNAGNAAFPASNQSLNYISNDIFTNQTNASLIVIYEVRGVSVNGCIGDSEFINLTVDPEPVIDPNLDASVCSDLPTGLVFAVDPSSTLASTYNLLSVNVATGLTPGVANVVPANGIAANYASGDVFTNQTSASLDVEYQVRGNSSAGCIGDIETITITINPEPVIDPNLDKTLCSDSPIELTLNTNGISITADNYNIVGINIPTGLTRTGAAIPATAVTDNYLFTDVYNNITNASLDVIYEVRGVSAGCIGESEFITVTIDPEPVISPNLDRTECSDVATGLVLTTTGTSATAASYDVLSISPHIDLTPDPANAVVANGVPANYLENNRYNNITNNSQDVVYEVRARSGDNCLSDIVFITVTIDPEPVIDPGLDRSACSDEATNLVLGTNGSSIGATSFNITNITVGGGLVADPLNNAVPASSVPATYLSAHRFRNATNGPLNVTYEVVGVSNDGCEGDSRTITVTIDAGPVVDPNLDATVCSDDPIGVTFDILTGSVAASNYNLINVTANPSLNPAVGNVAPAFGQPANYIANDSYTNTTSIPLEVIYEVRGVSSLGCVGPSELITVTIDPEPVVDPNLNRTVCSDEAVGLILATNGVSVGASQYNVLNVTIPAIPGVSADGANATVPFNGVVAGYLSNDKYTNTTSVTQNVVYEVIGVSGSTCPGDTRLITISILPEPIVNAGLDAVVCSDDPVGITLDIETGSVAAAGYNIINKSVPGGLIPGGSNVPVPANGVGVGYLTTDMYTNTTGGPINVTYEVRAVSADNCIGDSRFIQVTINPEPVISPSLINAVCSDDQIAITLNTNGISVGATDYDILNVVIPTDLAADPGNVANLGLPVNGVADNAIFGDRYTNVTSNPLIVEYEVRGRSADNCFSDPGIIRVTINPEPVVNPALDATVCSGDISDIALSTNGISVAAASYNLISNNVIAGAATPQAGNATSGGTINQDGIRNDRFDNTGTVDAVIEYRVVPVSPAGCEGEEEIILLTVQPEPVLDPALSPAPVCSALPSMITLRETPGTAVATTFNITGIAVQNGLIPGVGNSTIANGLPANAIFNDVYTNTTNNQLTVTYTIAPVTAAGCVGENATVIFTINPAPALADLNKVVCSEDASGIILGTALTSTAATDYDIIAIRPDGGLTPDAGNVTTGSTSDINYLSADIFTNPTNNPLTVEYDVVPVSGPGCRGPLSTVVLTIEPGVTVIDPGDEFICSGDATTISVQSPTVPTSGDITFIVTSVASSGLVTGQSIFLQLNNPSTITDVLTNNDDTPETVTYTILPRATGANNGAGCLGTSETVTVNVEPLPKLEFTQNFLSICEGQNLDNLDNFLTTPTLPSGGGTVEFVLNGDPVATGGVTGFSPGGTVFNPGDEILDVLNNPTTSNQTVTYTFTPRSVGTLSGSCIGNDVTLVVTVTPRPTVIADPAELIPGTLDVEICSGEPRVIDLTTDVANTISSWTVTDNPNVEGEFGSLGSSLFLSLINTSAVPQNLTYTITPFSLFDNTCTGVPIVMNVTVNPSPDVVIIDPEPKRCDGEAADILLNGNTPGTRFEWEAQVISGSVILPSSAGTGTNGDFINHVLVNNGTTPAIIRYTIRAFYDKITADPGSAVCDGLIPGFVTLTLSPPVNASILPASDGTNPRFRCAGNTEAIQFSLLGAAPFTLILDKIENGVVTRETLNSLPSQHVILATESVEYRIVEVIDANNCNARPSDNVEIVFEEAIADFTINGSKNPAPVTLDFNTGTVDVAIVLNNFNPANIYEMSIGDSTFTPPGASFTYTFTEPSPFGSIGVIAELFVDAPNVVLPCNDRESFFIQVVPAPVTIAAVLDFDEGCAPHTVNFESFRENLTLSRNVIIGSLTWDFGDGSPRITTPNPTHIFTAPGAYNVIVSGSNGYPGGDNEGQASLTVLVLENPSANFSSNQKVVFIPDQAFRPINNSSPATDDVIFSWDWDDGNVTIDDPTPEHFYEQEGEYIVELTVDIAYESGITCTATFSDTVNVEEGGFTKTPNAFTPNPNGPPGGEFDPNSPGAANNINDVFLPITEGVVEFRMLIFDRWGNLIFESDNKRFGWDGYDSNGNLLPAGVYVYRLELLLSDGNRTTRVGDVTLIR